MAIGGTLLVPACEATVTVRNHRENSSYQRIPNFQPRAMRPSTNNPRTAPRRLPVIPALLWTRPEPRLAVRLLLAPLVSSALARGDPVEGAPRRFHPHMGVPREHGAQDVPGDAHHNLALRRKL